MTLQELGMEYAKTEAILRKRINELRKQTDRRSKEQTKKLRERIWLLSGEASDCRRISDYLIHYYE